MGDNGRQTMDGFCDVNCLNVMQVRTDEFHYLYHGLAPRRLVMGVLCTHNNTLTVLY